MTAAIECIDLARTYVTRSMFGKRQEVQALKGINFSVDSGKVFGLLGPNGSGKTTTMRILATLLTPTSGKAIVHGFDSYKNPAEVRNRIGLILGGERGLYGRLTGRENLKYFAVLNKMSKNKTEKRVMEVLNQVNLTEAADMKTETYSRGMKQRLHIARGLLTNPDVILMDEPTIGLDPEGAHELRSLIPKMTESGKSVIMTTHYMFEADELSDSIAILLKGSIVAMGTPIEIRKNFSKTSVWDIILRKDIPDRITELSNIQGVVNTIKSNEGPVLKLMVYVDPKLDMREPIESILGVENIENMAIRDSTLEEAYLSIIR